MKIFNYFFFFKVITYFKLHTYRHLQLEQLDNSSLNFVH